MFEFEFFENKEGTRIKALRITSAYIHSKPKMGGNILNEGGILAVHTNKYRGSKKEIYYGQSGDYLVESKEDGSFSVITKQMFENELGFRQIVTPIITGQEENGNESVQSEQRSTESGTVSGAGGTIDANSSDLGTVTEAGPDGSNGGDIDPFGPDQSDSGHTGGVVEETQLPASRTRPSFKRR